MMEQQKSEENIIELLKSNNIEDQVLGCILAIRVLGREWAMAHLHHHTQIEHYPALTDPQYLIIKDDWAIWTYKYIAYEDDIEGTFKELGDRLTVIDLTEDNE